MTWKMLHRAYSSKRCSQRPLAFTFSFQQVLQEIYVRRPELENLQTEEKNKQNSVILGYKHLEKERSLCHMVIQDFELKAMIALDFGLTPMCF